MKRRIVILFAAFLVLAWVARHFPAADPPAGPMTVSFIGYTNEPPGTVPGNEPEAVFRLTNHTASRLDYHIDLDAVKPGRSAWESSLGGSGTLEGHGTCVVPVVTPGGTNQWRFRAVTSISGPRPPWQERVRVLLGRAGAHPLFLASDRKYLQLTNVWTVP
jgi:hypothetical protein